MKPVIPAIVLLIGAISVIGCSNNSTTTAQPTASPAPVSSSAPDARSSTPAPSAVTPSPTTPAISKSEPLSDLEPEVGIIQQIQSGDLMCYITFTDETGKQRQAGSIFELCEQPDQYLQKRVRLIYGIRNVSDCPSAEPCGKTRQAQVVVRITPIDQAGRELDADTIVLQNDEWMVTIGNRNSWSGVNNTGNLSYRGCNRQQACIDLTGGTVTCRNGTCATIWRNGEYSYTLASAITDGSSPSTSTLTVRQNDRILREITGLR
ncbi:hypothetical protein ACN4EK_01895 [Pantanalinema rosaneae CENA516]|uniref:hypothetical protein n=1 Tax=Pantanalinema rosaneae TaxID=1620701 RepID=UPI003D6DE0C0